MANQQVTIPPELENMLLEYAINALVENPEDLASHAAAYFARLRDERETKGLEKDEVIDEESKEYIEKMLGRRPSRRPTVMGESYNPEEDEDTSEIETYPKTDEQRKRIKERIDDIFLFRVLDEADLLAVIDAMIPSPAKKDEVIIQQGDDGDFFYLIDSGDFDILIKDENGTDTYIDTYKGSGYFGELALLHNQPRAATIKAATDGMLWAVGRETFNKLIVKRAFQKRQIYMKLLDGIPQLKGLTDYEKMQVADALIGKSFNEGDIIVHEGDPGDGMYFIVEGKVTVRQKTSDGDDEELTQLLPGQFFGEMALVKHQPRAATVIALEPTKAAFLDVKAFERLLGPCMDIMKRHIESYKKPE